MSRVQVPSPGLLWMIRTSHCVWGVYALLSLPIRVSVPGPLCPSWDKSLWHMSTLEHFLCAKHCAHFCQASSLSNKRQDHSASSRTLCSEALGSNPFLALPQKQDLGYVSLPVK